MTEFVCPEAEYHGNPFRYCGVKGCGWMEEPTGEPSDAELLAKVRSAVSTLHQIVPPFWWSSPPNQSTADVMSGIIALEIAIGFDPDGWRQGNAGSLDRRVEFARANPQRDEAQTGRQGDA